MDALSCICVKPGPKKEENTSSLPPSVRVRVFSFLRVPVVLGIHHTTVAYSLSYLVLYHFLILQNSQSCYEDLMSNHVFWGGGGPVCL